MNRVRAILRHLLVLLLVASLVPGLAELAESVEHLAHDGHLPHSAEHELAENAGATEQHHDAATDEEHGCTPMQHHCGCHVSAPGVPPGSLATLGAVPGVPDQRPLLLQQVLHSQHWPPPTPPPIA